MPLTLLAPGARKGARKGKKYWLVRGIIDGRRVELSTKTADKAAAKQFLRDLERKIAAEGIPRPSDTVTFARAAELYREWRDPSAADCGRITRLTAVIGRKAIADLRQVDLVAAANRLYPNGAAATRNREAMRPAAAILHYAARNGLCAWLRVELFREPRPKTRAVSLDTAAALVAAAPEGPHRLILVWLFRQGTRISDTLRIRWEHIDLARQTVSLHVGKTDAWVELPLHPEVLELLAAVPQGERAGRLWPNWTQKTAVYRWLRPLARDLGIAFTPHMARHSVGTWLNEGGAGLRTIMAALGHNDPKSSIRYQTADVEIVRAAAASFAPLTKRAAS